MVAAGDSPERLGEGAQLCVALCSRLDASSGRDHCSHSCPSNTYHLQVPDTDLIFETFVLVGRPASRSTASAEGCLAQPMVRDAVDGAQVDDGVAEVHPRGELVQRERGRGSGRAVVDRS
jgi:hypothetical protein